MWLTASALGELHSLHEDFGSTPVSCLLYAGGLLPVSLLEAALQQLVHHMIKFGQFAVHRAFAGSVWLWTDSTRLCNLLCISSAWPSINRQQNQRS